MGNYKDQIYRILHDYIFGVNQQFSVRICVFEM